MTEKLTTIWLALNRSQNNVMIDNVKTHFGLARTDPFKGEPADCNHGNHWQLSAIIDNHHKEQIMIVKYCISMSALLCSKGYEFSIVSICDCPSRIFPLTSMVKKSIYTSKQRLGFFRGIRLLCLLIVWNVSSRVNKICLFVNCFLVSKSGPCCYFSCW